MEQVMLRIRAGLLKPLVDDQDGMDAVAVAEELCGLREDILNFENGHAMEVDSLEHLSESQA